MLGPFIRLLTGLPDADLVAGSLCTGVFDEFGALTMNIWHCPHGRELVSIGTYGAPTELTQIYSRISIHIDAPAAVAYRTNQAVITDYADAGQSLTLVPDLPKLGPGGLVSAPITMGGRSIGAFGFFRVRERESRELDLATVDAVSHLLGLWLSNSNNPLYRHRSRAVREAPLSLTPRQREILLLVAEGRTSENIAAVLKYSPSTVKQEVVRMMAGLKANSRQSLVEQAKRLALLD